MGLPGESPGYLPPMDDWSARNILRVRGNTVVLEALRRFLADLSQREDGYSYISEYSGGHGYSPRSPEWRLHVQNTREGVEP